MGYTAELTKLKEDSVTISVAGASSVFKPGESKEFDVDSDGSKDISITLSKIDGGRAEVIYKMLAKPMEEVKEEIAEKEEEKIEEKPIVEIKEEKSQLGGGIIIGLSIILIGLIGFALYLKKKS